MGCARTIWGGLTVIGLLCGACYEGAEPMAAEAGGPASMGEDDGEVMTGPGTGGPIDCIAGQEACECLDGACVGDLSCIDAICVPGPVFDIEEEYNVIGGVRLPIEIEVMADSFSWEQTGGPNADRLEGENSTQLLVDVPADAGGSTMRFTITATRNTVPGTREVRVNVIPADFSNFLGGIDDPEQAGTVDGLDFRENDAWVVSTEGFVSRFDIEGMFIERLDIGGMPFGGRFGDLPLGEDNEIDVMYVANNMAETIQAVVLETGEVRMVTNAMTSGGALGPVDFVIPADNDGELFFTNREGGQIFHYFFDNEADQWNTVTVLADLGTNPTALTLGPEAGYLYVGTVGRVWRVPILEEGMAGDPEVYLNLGPQTDETLEVDGIAFDEAFTMYVGTSGTATLHMARYRANGQAEVVRSFTDVGNAISAFTSVQFGGGDFGGATLYWTNGATGGVGRLPVGIQGL